MDAGYLLDTNVLSELMHSAPDPRVLKWFEVNRESNYFTNAVTRAEMMLGVALLPSGKRRERIALALAAMFDQDFADNCLPFDAAAADEYAILVAERVHGGKPISTEDAQIAAIAIANALVLVTRNRKDFVEIPGLTQIDPWAG